ncbi:MAG: hypothetical protein JWP76_1322, partial [Dactylosporangium sp.]|nr:hypothetical protein [Dactylosporangium sp.]
MTTQTTGRGARTAQKRAAAQKR